MKLYMITLQGQGDTDIRLVRQDGWDALDTGVFTDEMLADYVVVYGKLDGDLQHIENLQKMEGSSPDNDVAINLPPVTIKGTKAQFYSVHEVTKFLRDNPEITIEDEYSGYIY